MPFKGAGHSPQLSRGEMVTMMMSDNQAGHPLLGETTQVPSALYLSGKLLKPLETHIANFHH